MGPITDEQLQHGRVQFVSVNKDSGKFEMRKNAYPAFEGFIAGFDKHEMKWKDQTFWKFDIYLQADLVYQVQFGFYSYTTLSLMNSLLSIADKLTTNGVLRLEAGKNSKSGENYVYLTWNGKKIEWKLPWEDLKFNGKEGDAKLEHRNKIIDKWYDALYTIKPYVAEITNGDAAPQGVPADDDDIPF